MQIHNCSWAIMEESYVEVGIVEKYIRMYPSTNNILLVCYVSTCITSDHYTMFISFFIRHMPSSIRSNHLTIQSYLGTSRDIFVLPPLK